MRTHLSVVAVLFLVLAIAACSNDTAPQQNSAPGALTGPVFDVLPPGEACMGDFIWNDLNMNGIQDQGEPGLGGVTVKLYECPSDVLVDETTSEADGYYGLFGPENDDYYIVVTAPAGYVFSPANQGADDKLDSDVDANGVGFCTNLGTAEIEKDMDAGLYMESTPKKGEIGDRVWLDDNCDGIQDDGEKGVKGVTVMLKDCAGQTLATLITDDGGLYCFTNLDAGDYTVCFELPAGFEWSPANQGGDDAVDSDVDPSTGCTSCFTLAEGQSDKTRDAGLCTEKKDGGDGCTPGYWKTKANDAVWGPTGYHWDDYFDDVFGCGPHETLLNVMWTGGGHEIALYRHAVAALLNASHPLVDYDMSVGDVIDLTCTPGDVGDAKDALELLNELGCPINAHGELEGDADDGGDKSSNKGRRSRL